MEASVLLSQLTKGRESVFAAGGFDFTMRRPSEMELVRASVTTDNQVVVNLELLQSVVIGWAKVKESDVVPGGAEDPIPFNGELYRAWIQDRPDLWPDMIRAVQGKITEYRARFEGLSGN